MRALIVRLGLAAAVALSMAGCGGTDNASGALLGSDNLSGGTPGANGSGLLKVVGPNGADSGTLEVEAGSLTTGFVASLVGTSGQPVVSRYIGLKPQTGFVNAPPTRANSGGANTDSAGQVRFSYQAPDDITKRTVVPIVATASLNGNSTPIEVTYELAVIPAPPPVITMTCPANAAPGIANTGYSVLVARSTGEQIPGACITVTSSGGTVSPPPSTTCSGSGAAGNETNDSGRFDFSLTPPATIAQDTVLTITTTATVAGNKVTKSCQTTARADTFQFTAPKTGTPIVVGSENRQPLNFQWTRAPQTANGSQGVAGTLTLQITGGGRLVFNDDPFSESQSITVTTSAASNGDFERPVSVFSNNSGQATISAREQTSGRTAQITVQFVDSPGEINLDATPLLVQTSPNAGRFSNLQVTVLNQAGAPITGVDVDFLLIQAAGSSVNERVFPQRQTTDASGQAKSRYEAGPTAGTARVQVRVEGGGLSNVREITVEAPPP